MTGKFVRSKAGHDKDQVYVVIREEGDFFYLCDGNKKLLDGPKKKRKKHCQPILCEMPSDISTNEAIKKSIKDYVRKETSDV